MTSHRVIHPVPSKVDCESRCKLVQPNSSSNGLGCLLSTRTPSQKDIKKKKRKRVRKNVAPSTCLQNNCDISLPNKMPVHNHICRKTRSQPKVSTKSSSEKRSKMQTPGASMGTFQGKETVLWCVWSVGSSHHPSFIVENHLRQCRCDICRIEG